MPWLRHGGLIRAYAARAAGLWVELILSSLPTQTWQSRATCWRWWCAGGVGRLKPTFCARCNMRCVGSGRRSWSRRCRVPEGRQVVGVWFDRVEAQRRLKKLSSARVTVLEYIGILLAEGGPLPPDTVLADLVGVSPSTVLAARRTGTALGLLDGKLDQTGPAEMSDARKDDFLREHRVHSIARSMRAAGESYDLNKLRKRSP